MTYTDDHPNCKRMMVSSNHLIAELTPTSESPNGTYWVMEYVPPRKVGHPLKVFLDRPRQ